MNRLLLSAGLLFTLSMLFSAELVNGQLFLELYVADGKNISIAPDGELSISEINAPVSRGYDKNIRLQLVSSDEQPMYGLVNKAELITPDADTDFLANNIREKFVWIDGTLAIQYEKLTFEERYFSSREAALRYAGETGYTKKSIRPIPMQNTSIKVTLGNGDTHYFQLPARLNSKSALRFNDQVESFSGSFIIKPLDGKLLLTHLQDLENYVAGVVPNEIGNLAPEQALKAQAVAARTHAVSLLLFNRHADDGYDLCNGTHCQVYKGNHLRNETIDQCIYDTKGVIMMYDGVVADGVYHSNCGGKTESNQHAWSGKAIPYLQGVACYAELDSTDLSIAANAISWIDTSVDTNNMASWEKRAESWTRKLSLAQLQKSTGIRNLHTLEVLRRGVSGRILKLKLIGDRSVTVDGEYKIRQTLGSLPSSFFYIANSKTSGIDIYTLPESITIKGKGFGHGVGLCQVGALQKARQGWSWQEIILHYYPGITLSSAWLNLNSKTTKEME